MQIEQLYQAHFTDVQRYLKRFVTGSQAEDLAQDVFVKAGAGLQNFRGEANPKTWLYSIATNTLRDFLKSKSYRQDQISNPISEQELKQFENPTSTDDSIEQGSIRNEMNACIQEFIQRLPEQYSTVLVLGNLEGYANKEIADILGISLETAKIRLHRARARLKIELSQGCDFSHNKDNVLECQRKNKN